MNLSKSIDFLLENAGCIIKYRLKKEILNDLKKTEEESLLEQIYNTPNFNLVQSYVKPNGYIGSGAHSWDNWRGVCLHETPLQDGEAAARLLSYYAVPKTHPIIVNFIKAMRNEETLKKEFTYIPPEVKRYENRFVGINSGNCLMMLIYTMQALLGYGDDEELKEYQNTSLKGFKRIIEISSLDDIAKYDTNSHRKYNYPYIEPDEYFPCSYSLSMLAYTKSWRNPATIKMMADSINKINIIMKPDNNLAIKINGQLIGPGWALARPIKPFAIDVADTIMYRRLLTEIAMLGVGKNVEIIRESAANIEEAINRDGILRAGLKFPKTKGYSPYPTAYCDIQLEIDYKRKYALECDLTFWAVQFLYLYNMR